VVPEGRVSSGRRCIARHPASTHPLTHPYRTRSPPKTPASGKTPRSRPSSASSISVTHRARSSAYNSHTPDERRVRLVRGCIRIWTRIPSMMGSSRGGTLRPRRLADGLITVGSALRHPSCAVLIAFARAVQAPSAIPFSEKYPEPKEMTAAKIEEFKRAFTDAIERAKKAGFDFIEIHGAHVRPKKCLRGKDTCLG
jgi:hypothetical protein